jgi:hypothetical protein
MQSRRRLQVDMSAMATLTASASGADELQRIGVPVTGNERELIEERETISDCLRT